MYINNKVAGLFILISNFWCVIGTSGGGDLSVETTVDIGADTVAVVTGAQAVSQAVTDNVAELDEGEEAVALQSKTIKAHRSILI